MNLLRRELKVNLKAWLLWTGLTAVLYLITVALYPSIIGGQNLDEMMAMFPPELLQAFNMDLASLSTASGWLCSEGLTFYYLVGGLYASILGATIVLKEESDRTIEYLYARPVSKNYLLTHKIIAGVFYVVAFTVVVTIANVIALAIVNDLVWGKMLLLLLSPVMVFLALFGLALLLTTWLRRTKNATVICFALVLVAYFIQVISLIADKVSWLKYLTVFTLADSRYLLQHVSLSPWAVGAFVGIMVVTLGGTYWRYQRKEFL